MLQSHRLLHRPLGEVPRNRNHSVTLQEILRGAPTIRPSLLQGIMIFNFWDRYHALEFPMVACLQKLPAFFDSRESYNFEACLPGPLDFSCNRGCFLAGVRKKFTIRGFSNGEFQQVFIDHYMSEEIIADFRIGGIKFVGGTAAGKKVATSAGKQMKKCLFELGGSDAFLVLDDADIDLAVKKGITGRMNNNGQSCLNSKRFILHEKVYNQFRDKLCSQLKEQVIGDPMDEKVTLGPLSNKNQKEGLLDQVKQTLDKGAKLAYGSLDFQPNDPKLKEGFFVEPMVLENIPKDSPAYQDELFGPAFSLFKVATNKEAVELANDNQYALSACVFSKDIEKAEMKAKQLDAGSVFINDFEQSDSGLPGGGIKDSGYGRECYKDGMLELCNKKTIAISE